MVVTKINRAHKMSIYEQFLAKQLGVKLIEFIQGQMYILVFNDCSEDRIERLKDFKFCVEKENESY